MKGSRNDVRALIIDPTRELSEQIHNAIGGMWQQTGLQRLDVCGVVTMSLRRFSSGNLMQF